MITPILIFIILSIIIYGIIIIRNNNKMWEVVDKMEEKNDSDRVRIHTGILRELNNHNEKGA